MLKLAIDFHNHSKYSYDGKLSLEDFLNNDKIDVFAITDHNTFEFHELYSDGQVFYKIKNKYFITGEEIMTSDAGEVIGLIIKKGIQPFMTFEETIKEIKRQGGIVYLPHPYDFYRKGKPKLKVVLKYIDEVDIIEVFNAKYFTNFEVRMSYKLAERYKKIKGYGSDAHKLSDLAKGYVVLKTADPDISCEQILDLLSNDSSVVETVQIKRNLLKSLLKKLG